MSSKRKIILIKRILLILAVLVLGLLAAFYIYLPYYLESRIIPQLVSEAGIKDFSFSVRNIGLFGADLGGLRIGPDRNPALEIQSVQVDYSPRGLYRQRIDKITLSGIELYGGIANGRFQLRGVDIEKIIRSAQPQDESTTAPNDSPPLVSLERLAIRNSRINLEYNHQFYRIPFEFDIMPRDPEFNHIDGEVFLYPRGAKITAAINLNRSQRKAALNIKSETLDLGRFADITNGVADIRISGEMTLQAKANVHWAPIRLSAVNVSLKLQHCKINAGGLQFQNTIIPQSPETPFRVDLAQKNDNEWQISGSPISMVAPTPLTLSGFNGTIIRKAGMFASTGNFTAALHPSTQTGLNSLPLKIQDTLLLQGQYRAQYHQSGNWQCEITDNPSEATPAQKLRLFVEPYKISSSIPLFKLSAKSTSQVIDAAYMLEVPGVRIASASESVQIPQLTLKGTAQIANGKDGAAGVTVDLRAPDTGIKLEGAKIKISDISLSGKLNRNVDRLIAIDGVIQISGAGGLFSDLNTSFSGARGRIPFRWPPTGKSAKGSVSIANLKFKGQNLGGLKCYLRQNPAGFTFEGRHQSTLLPRMKLAFSGESRLFHSGPVGASIRVDLSRPGGAPDIELGKLFSEAAGMRLNGKLQLNGNLALNTGGFSGKVRVDFANGNLLLDKDKLALEGIRMSLDFPELPKIRSAPGQQVQFSKISLGDIVVENGKIDFQIESARSFLIEKMQFTWCQGKVETQSIRLSQGVEDYRITLYCDRLNLAKVLEQFGAAKAEGRGTVSGRIPLQYTKAKIRFDDGFLFSSPGEGGKIYLSGTDILTAGIPPDTPQFVQMELAAAALKDYDYSWAKLNITTEGEELLLQMKMDGKPAKTLPFVYKKDIGGFMKLEAGSKGSKFQGIRLDVNFRLPLDKLLQYKDLLEMIE
jgi:hypothetical protein